MVVVIVEIRSQLGFKLFGRRKVAAFEKAARQHTEPQFHLVKPGAMFGCEMKNMLMGRIREKRPALDAALQFFFDKGDLAPFGHQTTDVQTPVGVQIVHHPVIALHGGELVPDFAEVRRKVLTRAQSCRGSKQRSSEVTWNRRPKEARMGRK